MKSKRFFQLWVIFTITLILQCTMYAQEKGRIGLTAKAQLIPHFGISSWWICDNFILNDDMIGENNYFQSIVQTASNNPGTEYIWEKSGNFKIKIKVE